MINRGSSVLFSSLCVLSAWALAPSAAHAELDACGGIFLSGDAGCEYRPTQECMTECVEVAVESSCVAEIFSECESSCTATASTECESGCTETCTDSCTTTTTTEEPPDCMGLCVADCDESCGNQDCSDYEHRGACGRCCTHGCRRSCEARCKDTPPPTTTTVTECMPTCTTACSASCTAKANTVCQVDCQETVYVQCEEEMVEQCMTDCEDSGGAIFCDGQFVNADNAESCADQVEELLSIEIDIEGAISAAADAAVDTANDAADATSDTADCVDEKACSISRVGAGHGAGAFWLLGPLGFALYLRRRR